MTGDYFGKVYPVGTPFDLGGVSSEGENQAIEDAMYFILPSGWYAYIDEQVTAFPTVSWSSSDDYFLDVLGHMGKNYGLNFVVDWEQKCKSKWMRILLNLTSNSPQLLLTVMVIERFTYTLSLPPRMAFYLKMVK